MITYSEKSPTDPFTLRMGFVGGHNPHDSVQIFVNLPHAAGWYADTFKSEGGEDLVDRAVAMHVAEQIEASIRTFAPEESAPRLGYGGQCSEYLVTMFERFNKEVAPEEDPHALAAHAVRLRCEELLLSYPTNLAEDMELLDAPEGSSSRRFKLAVEFRLRKKAILQHMLMAAEDVAEEEAALAAAAKAENGAGGGKGRGREKEKEKKKGEGER